MASRWVVRDPSIRLCSSTVAEPLTHAERLARLEGEENPDPEEILDVADLAMLKGMSLIAHDRAQALYWFREAAAYATFALGAGGVGEQPGVLQDRACARHNHAVKAMLRCVGTGPHAADPAWREQLAAARVEIRPTTPARANLPCDELWLAEDFVVTRLDRVERAGFGVPLIVLSRFPNRQADPDRFLPERLRLPATAVLIPGGPLRGGGWRAQPATLALYDSAHETNATLNQAGLTAPLAMDLTTPVAHEVLVSPVRQLGIAGLLRPSAYVGVPGILMLEPYEPGRIPVLFIHGLSDSPATWLKMANWLQDDPVIRARYQFWFAYYPTGAPLMISATRLRIALRALRHAIDPARGDPALDQMVVVGHSLGGVISKQLVQSSGPDFERALITRPLEEVAMTPETRARISQFLHFEPEPSIRRVIFLCAPHRGSNLANRALGRFASALVARLGEAERIHQEIVELNGPDIFQPAYRRHPPNGVDNLKWDSPILNALAERPIDPHVTYHSIIGNLFPHAPQKLWTDGIVSYRSAHLEGAESEVLLRRTHFANLAPEAAAEVHRILRLHLDSVGP